MFDFSIVEYWTPNVNQEEFSIMLNLEGKPTVPDQLTRLCDCAVFPDWGKRNVKIGANDRKTMDLALRKLDRVQGFFKLVYTPIIAYLIYPEDRTNFQLRFVSLTKQTSVERTTLFGNYSKWNEYSTDRLFSVRLMDYDFKVHKYRNAKLDCGLVHDAYKSPEHPDWVDYKFRGREAVATHISSTEISDIIQDARKIAPEDLICEYHSVPDPAGPANTGVTDSEDQGPLRMEKARRHPRVKGREDLSDASVSGGAPVNYSADMGDSSSFGYQGEDTDSDYPPHQAQPQNRGTGLGLNFGIRPNAEGSDGSSTASGATTRRPRERLAGAGVQMPQRPVDSTDAETSSNVASRVPRERKPAPVRRHIVDENELGSTSEDNFLIETPSPRRKANEPPFKAADTLRFDPISYFAPGAFALPPSQPAPPQAQGQSRMVRRARERKVVTKEPEQVPEEKAEEVSEVKTRKYMRTLDQRKPNSTTENIRSYNVTKANEALFHAFDYVRGWRGELTLECKFGRLIYLDIPRNIVKKDIEWKQWDPLLASPETNLKSHFTGILSCQNFDMEYMRNLKLSGGELVFKPEPVSRRVTYELELGQKGKKMVLVVDADTFKAKLYAEKKSFGVANIVAPIRAWDYCIGLTGKKTLDLGSNQYIKAIYDSISCPKDTLFADIHFSVEGPSLQVKRVLVKSETRHTVNLERLHSGVPMEVIFTEVQELRMTKNPDVEKRYRAIAEPRNIMRQNSRLHWTCSMVPTKVNKTLKGNVDLEVGEVAGWNTEEVMGLKDADSMVMPGLMNVLNQMIVKLDAVGSTNNAFV